MNRNVALDIVRGAAILQVFVWHFLFPIVVNHVPLAGRALSLTWTGVDLFFVLSGFLIGGILLRNVDAENFFRVFYARRMLRILPLYFITLLFFFLFVFNREMNVEYLFLVQNFVWAAHNIYGPNDLAPTWSLAVEEQFYLILPLLIVVGRPARLPWICVALIACAPLYRVACVLTGYRHAAYLLLPGRMDALFFGVLLAWAHYRGYAQRAAVIARWAIVPLGCACAVLAMLYFSPLDPIMQIGGYSMISAFYVCVLALVSVTDGGGQWYWRPFAWAGLGAFSIYLSHVYIGHLAYRIFGPHPAAMVAMVAGTALLALLSWKLVEKPLIDFSHRRFKYRRSSLPSPQPEGRTPQSYPAMVAPNSNMGSSAGEI